MAETLAYAEDLRRRYGDVAAVDGVTLQIGAGELLGLLGPNGAGKSTLINLFTGLRAPTSGRVALFGQDPRSPGTRRAIGVTPQETGLPAALRVGECIRFVASHFPDPLPVGEVLSRFGLEGLARRQTGGLSGGQRRRLAVALAFVGRPRLVFLDEPTAGLDVEGRHMLWEAIRLFHAEGGTVLLTSHYLEEIEALATRVVVLGQGRVLADGTVAELRGIVGTRRVSLSIREIPPLPGILHVERDETRAHLLTADSDLLVRELVLSGVPFADLEVASTPLEEAFLAITALPAVATPAA
ncbi:ABC transporter ATP-binding protein [Microbispora sp. CA-135349]|uniref:ABC transporter ATP-binding protein n=1 Tax=Microbispora sp. CA-135349 TaxID=3239953 RepID=UPI003D92D351